MFNGFIIDVNNYTLICRGRQHSGLPPGRERVQHLVKLKPPRQHVLREMGD